MMVQVQAFHNMVYLNFILSNISDFIYFSKIVYLKIFKLYFRFYIVFFYILQLKYISVCLKLCILRFLNNISDFIYT